MRRLAAAAALAATVVVRDVEASVNLGNELPIVLLGMSFLNHLELQRQGGTLTLTPISSNRREDRAPAERFHAEWGEDETGPFLALRHADQGYTFRLRQ